jgi:hypothetical protein
MTPDTVLGFAENIPTITRGDGLAFVKRMRLQLDRFDVALPGKEGRRMDPDIEAKIRSICDELETEILESLGNI